MSSKTLDIEEKTIDGAIEKACRDFGVPREKLNIDIISEGSNGFLGLGSKKAKIRASLLSFDMSFSLDDSSQQPSRQETKRDRQFESKPNVKPDIKPEAKREKQLESKPNVKPDIKPEAKREKQPEQRPDTRNKIEHQTAKPAPPAPKPSVARIAPAPARPTETPVTAIQGSPALAVPMVEAVPASTPSALKARELLIGILSGMTFECEVIATETNETIILSILGDKSGLLIGRRGQNLDALQYILNKAINKAETERKMIVVDSEEYRKRREESLLEMAERIREKVIKTQKPLSLSHMNAHDRRIIHLALQEDESLITKSRGEGEYRKVIVLPAKKGNKDGSGRAKNRR